MGQEKEGDRGEGVCKKGVEGDEGGRTGEGVKGEGRGNLPLPRSFLKVGA